MKYYAPIAVCLVVSLLLGTLLAAQAPAPNPRDIQLVGDRFKPLKYDEMTPAQKTMMDHLAAGERRGAGGPFNVLLRSPEMGDLVQQFGASMRFHSSLPRKLNEMAIIITARQWMAQYEWNAHRNAAAQAGLNEAIIKSIAAGKRPESMDADETIIYNFGTELLTMHQVSDANFKAVKDKFGERGVVDLISVMGYYQLVSMLLNVDRYPLPVGVKPELQPLK
ncbi:MAG TPA: carboxymuconolactone decarboxylase family protein [Terriglobia bacterium]|nr:carboxymuconolactone decarboxylase family protein [Terriglobia bacterium]